MLQFKLSSIGLLIFVALISFKIFLLLGTGGGKLMVICGMYKLIISGLLVATVFLLDGMGKFISLFCGCVTVSKIDVD